MQNIITIAQDCHKTLWVKLLQNLIQEYIFKYILKWLYIRITLQ